MYCECCGSKVYDNEKFCQKCGTKIKRFKSPESMKNNNAGALKLKAAEDSSAEKVKIEEPAPAAEDEKAAETGYPEEEAAQETASESASETVPSEVKDEPSESAPEIESAGAKDEPPEAVPEIEASEKKDKPSESAPEIESAGAKDEPPETEPEIKSSEVKDETPEAGISEVKDNPSESASESVSGGEKEDSLKEGGAAKPEEGQEAVPFSENKISGGKTQKTDSFAGKNNTAGQDQYSERGKRMSEEKETGKENKKEEKKEARKENNKKEKNDDKKTEDKSREKNKEAKTSGTFKTDSESSEKKKKKNIQSSYPVTEAARQALGSPFLLLGTAALCAQIVLMLIYAFSANAAYAVNFMGRLFFFHEKGMLFFRMAVIAIAVIEAFMFSGFLISWISARRKKKPFKTAGLSILQVLSVIGLIAVCFAGLCAIGALLVLIRYLKHYTYISFEGVSTGQIVYVVCMAAALIAVYIFVLIFFTKLVRSIGCAKLAAAEGIARRNIALYNAVMLIVIAFGIVAFSVASLLTSAPSAFILILAELCLALACVLYAAFMIIYRTKMKRLL